MKKMTKNLTNEFPTKILAEAAYLRASGCEFLRLEKSSEEAVYLFVFSDKSKCAKLSMQYWSKEGSTIPRVYFDTLRDLRNILYKEQRGNGKKENI